MDCGSEIPTHADRAAGRAARAWLCFIASASTHAAFAQCPTSCPPAQRVQLCIDAGRADNFAGPDDPVSPRPELSAVFCSGNCKGYDNPGVNRRFVDTFRNLPCGIVSASLEIRLRAECDIPGNDTLYLGYDEWINNFAWGSFIRNLPGAGGVWACPTDRTFTLDLAALPSGGGPVNLLARLNADHFLDVYVQDDTSVEYAKLTLGVCPCAGGYRVYQAGYADNFSSSLADPASTRQPRLDAIRNNSPFLWKETDDCTVDRGWGQTFGPLPPGIVRAQMSLRALACGSGSTNDSLHLELLNDGTPLIPYATSNFYRGYNLGLLAPPWIAPTSQTFTFDLNSAAPTGGGCTNFLGAMTDGRFDLYLQDDTAVDFARLRVWPCPPLRRWFGTPMHPTGQADITTGQDGRPAISSLGSTGQDGVAIDIHGADGLSIEIDPDGGAALAAGEFCTILIDAQAGGLVAPLSSLRIAGDDSGGLVFAMPTGPAQATHTVILRNSVTGVQAVAVLPQTGSVRPARNKIPAITFRRAPDEPSVISYDCRLDAPTDIVCSDGTSLVADTILISDELDGDGPPEELRLTWGSEGGAAPGIRHLHQTGIIHRDLACRLVGPSGAPGACMDTNPGMVTISNIGGSGDDGLEMTMAAAESWSVGIEQACLGDPANCIEGLELHAAFTGSLGGQPHRPLGNSTVRWHAPSSFDLSADLSDTGTDLCRVRIFSAGTITGEYVIGSPIDISVSTQGAPSGCGKQAALLGGVRTSCLWWDWSNPAAFVVQPGLPPVVGDQIRILAEHPGAPFDYVESATIRCKGVDELSITAAAVQPISAGGGPPCPADFNGDGGIDGADIDAFFAAWTDGAPLADVNGDGGIDGGDVEVFFARWEAGGCG